MFYGTYSEGFRPGGVNRRGTLPPYKADFLKNYEIGWKTTSANGKLRFNGAVFIEDWNNFQFSFLGENSLTQIANAANARMEGIEAELQYRVSSRLTWSGGFAYTDAKLTENYCNALDANDDPITDCANPEAPKGTRLPVTPKVKANVNARYTFPLAGFDAHMQGVLTFVSHRSPDLRVLQSDILGQMGGYALFDFAFGVDRGNYGIELFVNNAFDRRAVLDSFAQCDAAVCGLANKYLLPTQPRLIGLKFNQRF
jgi:iron complex outermembrane receptor protein